MTPPTVNAVQSGVERDGVSSGDLAAGFYDPKGDDAYNYGAIGAVIGHEITHGFDDQGSKFDAKGNLKDWWKEEDVKHFKERATACPINLTGMKSSRDCIRTGNWFWARVSPTLAG